MIIPIGAGQPLPDPPATVPSGLVLRHNGRAADFLLYDTHHTERPFADVVDEQFGLSALALLLEDEVPLAKLDPAPSITVSICTHDRPERLARLLDSLDGLRSLTDEADSPFTSGALVVRVVDNAPSDDRTKDLVATLPWVDYVCEPKPGLDFARNAALDACDTDVLAFLDDDVVVDAGWFDGLQLAWRANPDIGGVTGFVLPFALDTDARVEFERFGGFRRGHRRLRFGADVAGAPLHPSGAGSMGAGCNMSFNRQLLHDLGGFDNALDSGAPLPGGGDLDIFYRVARSGRGLVYEPGYAVYHEHRETREQLTHQYFTWGLGLFAFLTKASSTDPANRPQHRALRRWWMQHMLRELRASRAGHGRPPEYVEAELRGAAQGMAGEYRRSQKRIEAIEEAHR